MVYRFGCFELDPDHFELRADGVRRPVEPQVFSVLLLLVENRERVVSKGELIEKVWDGRIVSEAAISSRIKSARQALGDDGRAQRFIQTRRGRGFRFVAEVRTERREIGLARPSGCGQPTAPQRDDPRRRKDAAGGRPSIAVLPFRLVGSTGAITPMADAMRDELIAELSRLQWLFVTSRASSCRLRGREHDPEEVGRALRVRYCLSGVLELMKHRLAVTVELADTRDGGVVWAERFEGAIDDVHALRADVRSKLLAALEIRIPMHEATIACAQPTEALDAWSAYHFGLRHMYRFNRRDNVAAAALFEQATALDSGFARAHAGLSFVHFQTAFLRHTDDLATEIEQARRFAERSVELDPIDPVYCAMRATRAFGHMVLGEDAAAADWAERAARSPGAHVLIAMIAVAAHALGGRPGLGP